MNTKSKKNVIAGLLLLVCMIACIAIATAIMPTVVYAESASPYLQVTCGSIDKSGDEQPEKTGLSGGAIAGIAVGSVAVAGVGGFSVFWFVIKKKKFADLIAIFKKK